MKTLKGAGASKGIAIGKVVFMAPPPQTPLCVPITDPQREVDRFFGARQKAFAALESLYHKARQTMGENEAMIFKIHTTMLEDPDYIREIAQHITEQQVNAEFAVYQVACAFEQAFAGIEDEYLRERIADIRDVSDRLLRCLRYQDVPELALLDCDTVLVGEDILPSDVMLLDKNKIKGIATKKGSVTSHASILARTRGVPSVVGLGEDFAQLSNGQMVIVDGESGCLIVEPDSETINLYREKQEARLRRFEELQKLKDKENTTIDGKKIKVCANVGAMNDVEEALACGCDGIGLLRTEYFYMNEKHWPTEEQQFADYKAVLLRMEGRQVVVRTYDLGSDKQAAYLTKMTEANPSLGCRGLRLCLQHKGPFMAQIRALLRASVYGKLAVMFPMVTCAWEVEQAMELVAQAKEQLAKEGLPYATDIQWGIMIETPAAALISSQLAQMVDFFSVGTNDLTQYTLAADRMNETVANIYSASHPAVLQLIGLAAQSAHQAGKWIGLCGDAAADETMTETLIQLGVDEISLPPYNLPEVRDAVRHAYSCPQKTK